MKKLKKFMFSPKGTLAVFAAAMVLLLLSSVGGARAALTYYSENHETEIRTQEIGVKLVENSTDVTDGALFEELLGEGDTADTAVKIGKTYATDLSVENNGQIDQYVRVTVYRYWTKDGAKQKNLYPGYIHLTYGEGWVEDKNASTLERTVLYYTTSPLGGTAGTDGYPKAVPLVKDLTIDPKISNTVTTNANGITYDYQGCEFHVEVEVDAVQTHNAKDAIWSAWGKDVTVDGAGLSGIN